MDPMVRLHFNSAIDLIYKSPSGQHSFFAQTGREKHKDENEKCHFFFVNDEKVMQKQGVLNFDHKDQQSTCRRSPVTNKQRITYVH